MADQLGVEHVTVVPVAAVTGENIVDRGRTCPGTTARRCWSSLKQWRWPDPARHAALRFPVQYVVRPHTTAFHDYRGYAGTLAAGRAQVGDEVTVLPLGVRSRIAAIDRYEEPLRSAESGDAVSIRLTDDLDVGRGYMIVDAAHPAPVATRFTADLCWMNESVQLRPRQQFWIKQTSRRVRCLVEYLDDRLDVSSFERKTRRNRLL